MSENRPRILLVDDDTDLLRLLSIRLENSGYKVGVAENASHALAQLPLFKPQLVITDLRMSGMDGMSLFEVLHESNPVLPVIIITAHGSIPEAVAATRQGVFSFLTKPLNSRELIDEIQKALSLNARDLKKDTSGNKDWRHEIFFKSVCMGNLLSKAEVIAASASSVLIQGESGTGKELLARAIHMASPRASKPFVAINCGAIPETLLESELFGHIKGSFTGAEKSYEGLFRAADSGTFFMDEIGDMPLSLQIKFLRVLEERQVRPIGGSKTIPLDIRIISATNQNLTTLIDQGSFRQDLYFRLNVVTLKMPPLRERKEDIPMLADHFVRKFASRNKKKISGFSPDALELMVSNEWPGNVRQLMNVVESSVVMNTSPIIPADLVQSTMNEISSRILPFSDAKIKFEQEYLIRLLHITDGNISRAARIAKRNRTDFYKLLRRNHISPGMFKTGPAGKENELRVSSKISSKIQ